LSTGGTGEDLGFFSCADGEGMKLGYIKLYRQLREHPIWTTERFTRGQAWVDLLMLAQFTDFSFRIRGNLVKLDRGQIGHSKAHLAGRWKWDRKTVQKFLDELEKDGMITQQKTKVVTVVTVVNYGTWQDSEEDCVLNTGQQNPHQKGQQTGQQNPQQTGQQNGHKEEGKEYQEGKEGKEDTLPSTASNAGSDSNGKPKKRRKTKHEYHPDFLTFYEAYPRSVGIAPAFKAWQAAGKGLVANGKSRAEAVAYLLEAATAFAGSRAGQRGTKTPHPATWLNNQRYRDDRADWDLSDEPDKPFDIMDVVRSLEPSDGQ
jgi:hypothetical protein